MRRVGVTFWPVVGMIGFIALVLCGLGVAAVAIIFVSGAPQAINAVTGTRRLGFVFLYRMFLTLLPAGSSCRCATVRTLLRSPTSDATKPPAFLRWR
jgi:hypothetical protein